MKQAVRLSWLENDYLRPLLGSFWIFFSKVGHIGLVFGVPSMFINKSVCARLKVSVFSGYNLCHRG